MKKLLCIVGLLAGFASAQTTTITGTIKDLTNAAVTSGKVTFTLQPSRDTTISGLARFAPLQVVCLITGTGAVKAQDGTSTCTITTNTSLQPTGTYYKVDVWPGNVKTSSFTFYAVLTTYDISTIVPTPTTSPAQNFVDVFSNQTIGGNKIWSGTQTFNGSVVWNTTANFPFCSVNGVLYVGAGLPYTTCWGSSDIGAQIDAAYAALPANGGTIVVVPKADGSCYTFSTPVVATTSGKYLLLKGLMVGGGTAGCLNYTPTTGSAMTLDFVPIGGPRGGVFGVRDLWLTNNLCTSIGGCGGSTTGISATNTNDGIDGGMMENVTIQGFTVGYGENAPVPSSAVQWINARIYNNGAGMNLFNSAEEQIVGGTFYGNGAHIQAGDTNSHPELHITGTYFIAHSIEAFDFTRTSLGGTVYLTDVHFENGASTSANAHYIEGAVSIFGKGGVAEDDSSLGTADWWFKPSGNGTAFMWDALELVTGSRNPSIGVLNLTGNTRAKLTGFVVNPGTLTAIVGGANAGKATVCLLSGDITNGASACKIEAPLQDVNGLSYSRTIASGTATMTTAAIAGGACGTTVTVSATGTLTTDAITDSFNAAVAANPGVLIVQEWPTANNVNFEYCNPTAGSVTPTAATLNWRVVR